MSYPLMKCGHVAQGINSETKEPVCVICVGIDPRATIIDDAAPSLKGRKAKCTSCGKEVDSNYNLPFFEYGGYSKDAPKELLIKHSNMLKQIWKGEGNKEELHKLNIQIKEETPTDAYYCGCRGWD